MKKIYVMVFAIFSIWQINSQVLNQNAGWPNAAWTITGTYNTNPLAFEANPTTTANFAFDDDDAGNPSDDSIAAESPIIDLTPAATAGELSIKVDVQYGYRFLGNDVLRFEYWDADAAAWVVWSGNIPGNNTTVTNDFCTIPKTGFTSPILSIAAFTATQLSGFKYRIYYNDDLAAGGWNWGFCFDSPVLTSIPDPCLTGFNFPAVTTVPGTCDGITPTTISEFSWAGDYFYVSVTNGQTYKFSSSVNTDYFTLSTDDGVSAAAFGTSPLTWVSNFTGDLRVHLNTNLLCGTEDVDRATSVICGITCLAGTLYPGATYTVPTCDGTTVNVVAADSWAGEYSNINVFAANTYTFSSSVATDYITIASADGTIALAAGTGSLTYTPVADGVLRFYFHTNAACGNQNVNRERRIVCATALVVPGCSSNPNPADGAIDVPAFSNIGLFWDAPTTGDPATSYDIYIGDSIATLVFAGNVATNSIPDAGQVGAYSTTIFWQVVPRNAAGPAVGCAVWSFTTEPQPTDTPDFVNLQFPYNATITQGGSVTVYGQIYEGGLTDVVPNIDGQAPGILAWVGTGATGTDPSTWTDWTAATWNSGHVSNNDEYQANIGTALAPGTYDYATRFTLNGGPFVYGGINNGFWNATTNPSGVLTIDPALPPANDTCAGAIALIPGGVFADNAVTGTVLAATNATETPSCAFNNIQNSDVWYSVQVPASGNLTIETQVEATNSLEDTTIAAFSGTCGSLVEVGCDDDAGAGLMSLMTLTGRTPGEILYIGMWKWGTGAPTGAVNQFKISAYDDGLGTGSFDNANFAYYPNPVKNILNLSYNQEISNVEVFNLLGQKLSSNAVNANSAQIDMSNLSKGAYMVRVTSNDQVKTVKVIKE